MSVIVTGMEMPKVCITEGGWYHSCPLERTWCAQRFAPKHLTNVQIFENQEGKIPDWCPLRPLPEKHGRLIDADAFDQDMFELWKKNEISNGDWIQIREWLQMQPTIIEEEGQSDE